MKHFLTAFSAFLIVTLMGSLVHAEPPYDHSTLKEKHSKMIADAIQSESVAYVDSTFTIEAEWIGTPQWMTGYNNNYETFNGSLSRGINFFGSSILTAQYATVEIRFDADTNNWSNAQIFRRDKVLNRVYDAYGVGTFPGSAWDMTDVNNPRRLNVCFVEWDDGPDPLPPVNGRWDPDNSEKGKQEYLFVMRSDYDSTGNAYDGTNILYDDLDLLYTWWPRVADGHTFFETDTAAIRITPHIGLATISSNTSIELVWAYPGIDPYRFKIFYSENPNPDQLLVQLTSNAIRYTHNNLLPDQEYYYQMFSYDIDGNEIYSSPVVRARTREVTIEIDLLAQWHLRSNYGDIWGYTDSLSGTEYALLCVRAQGLSIIEITDSPLVEVGFISGSFSSSDVKDVKVYSHYVVIICETAPTQIFDIADVTNPVFVSTIAGGRHNGYVDGHYVYLVGGAFSGLEIFSIEDPFNPAYVGEYNPFYYHDVAIRNDTMAACGIYGNGVDLLDLTDKANPQLIGNFNYPMSGAHNAAFSEDGNYVFVGDEIGTGNYTRVFDISDLNNISMVSTIIVNPFSIVHNCYVIGNHLYIAHYAEGLRVWNIADPTLPYEVAFYDTHPEAFTNFIGAWGVYPFFASGKIIISDMQFGLFVFNSTILSVDCCEGVRGNINDDEDELDVVDLLYLVNYIFRSGPPPECPMEADVNADGKMGDIHDLLYMINVIYRSGPQPPACP